MMKAIAGFFSNRRVINPHWVENNLNMVDEMEALFSDQAQNILFLDNVDVNSDWGRELIWKRSAQEDDLLRIFLENLNPNSKACRQFQRIRSREGADYYLNKARIQEDPIIHLFHQVSLLRKRVKFQVALEPFVRVANQKFGEYESSHRQMKKAIIGDQPDLALKFCEALLTELADSFLLREASICGQIDAWLDQYSELRIYLSMEVVLWSFFKKYEKRDDVVLSFRVEEHSGSMVLDRVIARLRAGEKINVQDIQIWMLQEVIRLFTLVIKADSFSILLEHPSAEEICRCIDFEESAELGLQSIFNRQSSEPLESLNKGIVRFLSQTGVFCKLALKYPAWEGYCQGLVKRRVLLVDQKRSIGRNDPCFCGSGKKYKKCCLGKK